MNRKLWRSWAGGRGLWKATCTLAVGILLVGSAAQATAQEPVGRPVAPRAGGSEKNTRPPAVKRTRRLPPLYSRVVTSPQRLAIYDIQDKYRMHIEALQVQIDVLRQQMTGEIDRLLTPEQVKLLADLKQQSRRAPQVVAQPVEPIGPDDSSKSP